MPASAWHIGVARQTVTPPLGCQMAGFDARKGVATSVHDDLHARALVFDDGNTQVVFISVEVIAVSAEFADLVRTRISSATGISASHIFLCATHTHCGPVTLHHFFNQGQPLDDRYLQALADGIVDCAIRAANSRKPRLLRSGLAPCEGIAVNRRTKDGLPVDPYAGVLLVEELDGTVAAVAVLYACHTTVLGPDTLSLSQDFPFYTLAALQSALGPKVEALFFNGAEGDLSIGHKSDLSAVGIVDSFRTFETAKRLGEKLAQAVVANLEALTHEVPFVDVLTSHPALPLKQYEPLARMTLRREEAAGRIDFSLDPRESLVQRQKYLFARIEEFYAKLYEASPSSEPKSIPIEFSSILLGETCFLTLPGEVFVSIALAIRKASPFAKTLFLGLTNDYIGYMPDEQATADSGYEVIASRVPASAGQILQQEAAIMLKQLETQAKSRGMVQHD
jgi:neutral ceramidase